MSDDFPRTKDKIRIERLVETKPDIPDPIEPDPAPEDFRPLEGDKFKLAADGYKDPFKAGIIVHSWESDSAVENILNAADLNNIGCAYVWIRKPNYAKAKSMFTKARRKAPSNTIILDNLDLLS